jgi:MtN3 and saliva related transmembrane protein
MDYIGYAGSFCISINLIPQIFHIWKLKKGDSIPTLTYLINITAASLMIIYGTLIMRIPVIIANSAVLLFSICMLVMKFYFKTSETETKN